jgi:hypothetical protein
VRQRQRAVRGKAKENREAEASGKKVTIKVLRVLAYALIVIGFIDAAVWLGMFYHYANTRPHHREPQNGRVIPLYDHGMVSYLTKEEDNRMTLLSYSAVIICAGGAILEGIRNWQGRKP